MITDVNSFSILVPDQEAALQFYTEKLGFEKRMDLSLGGGRRWITVAPPEAKAVFVLQPLDWFEEGEERDERERRVGKSATCVLLVDDCYKTCAELSKRGVTITDQPAPAEYGVQASIEDLYGNSYVLLQLPS
ncbi:MAG TPA: VOC family protein [Ktedonosporobacter sp.]|nr:VOC family protein [Ktedonosporobacter sp.]